jgi:hypothetical protein
MKKLNLLCRFALLLPILLALGCGNSGRVSISGRVTLDGAPLPTGSITFIPEQGNRGPTAGAAIEDGEYFIDGAKGPMPGPHRIEIRATESTGRTVADPRMPGDRTEETRNLIPARYSSGKPEGLLRRDLEPGDNVIDLELTSR